MRIVIRTLSALGVAALGLAAMLAMVGDAAAQKRDRRCAPTYLDQCYKACVERGGQARYCPTYCQQQQREAKCG